MGILKRIGKIFSYVLLGIVGFALIVFILLQLPPIQNKLRETICTKTSEAIGLHVSVEKIYPVFWKGISLQNVSIFNDQNDTILRSRSMYATIEKLQLDSSFVWLDEISISKPRISLQKDSNGTFNIESLLQALQSDDTTSHFHLLINEISLRDAQFSYRNFSEPIDTSFGIHFNDIAISNMYLQAYDFEMKNNTYTALVDKLSCDEKSGFNLDYFHAKAAFCDTAITCSDVAIYTTDSKISAKSYAMNYDSFNDFSDFCKKVKLHANFNRSTTSLHDIAYFASALNDKPYSFSIEGLIEGTISDFEAHNFHIGYGRSSQFVGNVKINGLPGIDTSTFRFDIDKLAASQYDIAHTRIAPYSTETYVSLPEFLQNINTYKYSGLVSGTIYNLQAKGILATNIGKINADIHLKRSNVSDCSGTITFEDFDVAALLPNEDILGKVSGSLSANGSFNNDSLIAADIESNITKFEFNNYSYSDIAIKGKVSAHRFFGKVNMNDPNINLKFIGGLDMSKEIPEFRFRSDIKNARLDKLHLFNDSLATTSFTTVVDFKGLKLDDMNGDVSIRNAEYANSKGEISTKNIALNLSNENKQRTISLHSAFVEAEVAGTGQYKDLSYTILNLLNKHITCLPQVKGKISPISDFKMNVVTHQIDTIFSLLGIDIRIADNSTINADYKSSDNTCNVALQSPKLSVGDIRLHNCSVDGLCTNNGILLSANLALDSLKNTQNKVTTQCNLQNDKANLVVNWDYNTSIKTSGKLNVLTNLITKKQAELPRFEIQIQPSQMYVTDSLWNIAESNIVVDTTTIVISGCSLYKDNKKISIDGTISKNKNDYVVVNVQNYDLAELNPLIDKEFIRFAGPIEGRIRLRNIYETPLIFADINSPRISFNDNDLGQLKLRSFWDNKEKALLAKLSIGEENNSILAADGKYITTNDSIHFDVSLNDLQLKIISEILQGTVNNIDATVNGDLDIEGNLSHLNYKGNLDVTDGSFTVDYTHVPYTFSGQLVSRKSRFFFKNFNIFDASNNKGNVIGYLNLKNLPDIEYLFDIQTDKLLVMKTTAKENDYFYGTIYYNGNAKIEGNLNETKISGVGKTLENTECNIPVSYSELTGAYDFLLFASDTIVEQTIAQQPTSSNLTIDFMIDVTTNALTQIIFDPRVGDIIKARGNGDLHLKMDNGGDLKLYGKYQIDEGDYLFTLKNLINKKLIIEKGGTIAWSGDPLNGQVNLIANYETKASPQPLLDSSLNASKRIPVTCQVNLKNNLLSPDISYNILVPSSATQVNEVLATLTEDEKTLQFFSLLLQGAFISSTKASNVNTSSVSLEVLSNQFNNLLSQIDPNMDVSVNYRMGTDELTSNEFEFDISRQFWNERILVNVNGYTDFGGNAETNQATTQNSEFSKNVSVEMKLNKQGTIKIKGFSRSNEDELNEKKENTNGVGFFFTKDFDRIRDIFQRKE